MKKILVLVTAMLITLTSSVAFASDENDFSAAVFHKNFQVIDYEKCEEGAAIHGSIVNCRVSVTLREYPSVYADEIMQIPLGARVTMMFGKETEDFFCVRYQGYTGYVLREYVRTDDPRYW